MRRRLLRRPFVAGVQRRGSPRGRWGRESRRLPPRRGAARAPRGERARRRSAAGLDAPASLGRPRLTSGQASLAAPSFALVATALDRAGQCRPPSRRTRSRTGAAAARVDRAALIVRSDPQIVIAWDRPDVEPSIEGDFGLLADWPAAARARLRRLARARPRRGGEDAVVRLNQRGEAFCLPALSLRGRHLEILGRPVSGSAVVRVRDVSGDRLEATRMREKVAEAEATPQPRASRSKRLGPRVGTRRRGADGLVQRPLCAVGRSGRRARGRRAIRGTVRSGPSPRSGGGAAARRRLETPRQRGRRRRAAHLRGRRGRNRLWVGRRRLRRVRGGRAESADGPQRGRLFPHDRPPVDRGRDLRQVEAAHLLQCGLQPDVVARSRLPRQPSDRWRGPRPAQDQAPAARASGFPRLEGPADGGLSGDRAERDRLVPAGRPRLARRHQPQPEGRRHLSLRRRDAELCARLASDRAHPRPGRNARRAEGGRGGVRRRRTDETLQPGLRGDVGHRPARGSATIRISTPIAEACRASVPRARHVGRAQGHGGRPARASRGPRPPASSGPTTSPSTPPRCRCPTGRPCSLSSM